MRNVSLIVTILFLSSCCKAIFDSETLLNNTTSERIELRLYNGGKFTASFITPKSIIVAPFSFPSAMASIADSALVLVKDVHQQTHYSNTVNKPSPNGKTLQFDNPKNILNVNNYQITKEELSCNGSRTKYSYSF